MQHAKPVKMNSKWAKQNHILVKRLKNEIPGHKFIMKMERFDVDDSEEDYSYGEYIIKENFNLPENWWMKPKKKNIFTSKESNRICVIKVTSARHLHGSYAHITLNDN